MLVAFFAKKKHYTGCAMRRTGAMAELPYNHWVQMNPTVFAKSLFKLVLPLNLVKNYAVTNRDEPNGTVF